MKLQVKLIGGEVDNHKGGNTRAGREVSEMSAEVTTTK